MWQRFDKWRYAPNFLLGFVFACIAFVSCGVSQALTLSRPYINTAINSVEAVSENRTEIMVESGSESYALEFHSDKPFVMWDSGKSVQMNFNTQTVPPPWWASGLHYGTTVPIVTSTRYWSKQSDADVTVIAVDLGRQVSIESFYSVTAKWVGVRRTLVATVVTFIAGWILIAILRRSKDVSPETS